MEGVKVKLVFNFGKTMRIHKKSTCKTFKGCFSDSVKVCHGPADAEGRLFILQDQDRMISFNVSPKRLDSVGWVGKVVGHSSIKAKTLLSVSLVPF